MSNEAGFRCKKCRRTLFSSSHMVSSHGDPWSGHVTFSCRINKVDTVWYVRDENLPHWLSEQLDRGEWVKGKLYCPECKARLGSFDFVTGAKCDCDEFVLPPIHISKSRIDCDQTHKMASILEHIVKPPVIQPVTNSSELSTS
uniref:Putative e3 ubiquitin-protein ligase ovary overexpressed n=1 Tax=Rhipicephalus microplus TaxID=6941 RepID=A0A6M2CTI1_RHIMP